jgi:hypothetical protein
MDRRCWLTNRRISDDIEGEATMKRGIVVRVVTGDAGTVTRMVAGRGSEIAAQFVTGLGSEIAAKNNTEKRRKTKSVNIANTGPKEPTRKLHK